KTNPYPTCIWRPSCQMRDDEPVRYASPVVHPFNSRFETKLEPSGAAAQARESSTCSKGAFPTTDRPANTALFYARGRRHEFAFESSKASAAIAAYGLIAISSYN